MIFGIFSTFSYLLQTNKFSFSFYISKAVAMGKALFFQIDFSLPLFIISKPSSQNLDITMKVSFSVFNYPFRKSSFPNECIKVKKKIYIKDKVEEIREEKKHSRIVCDPTFCCCFLLLLYCFRKGGFCFLEK